ncbi:hypothetical protein ASE14_07610 [Agromyces sp. Root81]|uniref:RDD family protein n=1 Tax=Agromyces sp. Root81 TaxID=1736601 RepID=UPI0006F2EA19|nr:RDD family protein [Agromyces sp. Root81]KRC60829.1 hypothetical protein ASE14_07610 [Agromyces sp. Root81]
MSVTLDDGTAVVPGLDPEGRPDPAYAAGLGLVAAPGGRRSAAFALDATIWVALAAPGVVAAVLVAGIAGTTGWDAQSVLAADLTLPLILAIVSQALLFIFGLTQLVLHGRLALTVGKASFGLRSVNVATFGVPGFWRVVLRALVLAGAQLVLPFIGPAVLFASSAWDRERRGRSWLDRVGRCFVIEVRRGLNPLDGKALRHARRAFESEGPDLVEKLPSLASDQARGDLFIPAARSSSGVVSAAPSEHVEWSPPPVGSQTPASQPAAPVPPVAPAGGTAELPVIGGSTASASASASAPAPAVLGVEFLMIFDDGTRLQPGALGLIGRDPAASPGEQVSQFVPLDDPSMRISKTHAAFGVDASGFWIVDRASRNGTTVALIGDAARPLTPGVRTQVAPGARVTLGGRSFLVTESSGR